MSDLADKAGESCAMVEGAGGSFYRAPRMMPGRSRELPACSCGGRPSYCPHPQLRRGGDQMEVLKCSACANQVGPMSSRQALATAWRLGGWQAETASTLNR